MALGNNWCEVSPVGDLLVRAATLHPDHAAMVLPEERVTYAQLVERAYGVARGLWALGVRAGDHVGLLAPNGIEYVEAFFGIELLGAVVVPLNARHKAAELGYIADNADLVAVLTTSHVDEYVDFTEVLLSALPSLSQSADPARLELAEAPGLRSAVLLCGEDKVGFLGRSAFDRLADATDPEVVQAAHMRVRVRDTAVILYTSGTTAHPKGCVLSHETMTRGAVERAVKRFSSGEHDVTWGAGPLFHIGSLAPFLGSVGACGTYVTDVYFEPGRALRLMEQEGVTAAWPWFPAIIQGLLDHPTFDASRLGRLRAMLLIGPPALHERVHATFPSVEIIQACGMTETAGIYALSDPSESRAERMRAQGKAAPGVEIRIIDPETGADLPAGEVGEILVRGHCVMDGYYRDPEKTAAALDAERWLHTGDLYSRTAEGSLIFNGRLKDMLKVGGENVAALEVEAFLCEHPAVKTAEVVGAPDERLDEVPVAFVELTPGTSVGSEELIEWSRGKIASYKIPRAVHFVEAGEWPMSATKVDKRALRARLADMSRQFARR
jgi:fatty-acyl-CoA synthase/long-chain acyl-CoA synthetase